MSADQLGQPGQPGQLDPGQLPGDPGGLLCSECSGAVPAGRGGGRPGVVVLTCGRGCAGVRKRRLAVGRRRQPRGRPVRYARVGGQRISRQQVRKVRRSPSGAEAEVWVSVGPPFEEWAGGIGMEWVRKRVLAIAPTESPRSRPERCPVLVGLLLALVRIYAEPPSRNGTETSRRRLAELVHGTDEVTPGQIDRIGRLMARFARAGLVWRQGRGGGWTHGPGRALRAIARDIHKQWQASRPAKDAHDAHSGPGGPQQPHSGPGAGGGGRGGGDRPLSDAEIALGNARNIAAARQRREADGIEARQRRGQQRLQAAIERGEARSGPDPPREPQPD